MNFYTLTYDANVPTTQQLNIPTNTDYKIGVKVRRNGEVLDLNPEDLTLGTLTADAKKTNGYITFTKAVGDEPNMEQSELHAHYEPTTVLSSQLFDSPKRLKTAAVYIYNSDLIGNEPVVVKASDLNVKAWDSKGVVWTDPPWKKQAFTTDTSGDDWYLDNDTNQWILPGKTPRDEIELDPTQTMLVAWGAAKGTFDTYIEVTYGKPAFNQKFKLDENIFKSQQGDLGDIDFDNTVNIAGTLSDDTEFSYDALVK